MIVLSRRQARDFAAVLRRCVTPTERKRLDPFVTVRGSKAGSSLQAVLEEVALRLDVGQPAKSAPELALPVSALAAIGGEGDGLVRLEAAGKDRGRASLVEEASSRSLTFPTRPPDTLPPFPAMPGKFQPLDRGFLSALREASRTAAPDRTKFALNRVLLQGKRGTAVATDSKQMLVQTGLNLPWSEDVLIPRLDVWEMPELREPEAVAIGRTASHVTVRIGSWLIAVMIDKSGRFPPYEEILPRPQAKATRLQLPPGEVKRLLHELPRLPGRDEDPATVLLDLGERVTVRGQGDDGDGELELPEAKVDGPPVQVACDRRQLLRALRLGFGTIHIPSPDRPMFCRDEKRTFVWMPVTWHGSEAFRPPAKPAASEIPPAPVTIPSPLPETSKMSDPSQNGHTATNGAPSPDLLDPLAEAEALRALLYNAQGRLGRLLAALKQHRRQARAMRAAVTSLRRLPPLVP
jgi:hypothetical protein